MNFEKTAKSFKMHFGYAPEKLCFSGAAITILKGTEESLSASLSVGGCLALSQRRDGRIRAEFDDVTKFVSANVSELEYHKKEPLLKFLANTRNFGVTLGGADLLFEYQNGYEPLLLSALPLFCPKTVPLMTLRECLENPYDFASMAGKRGTMLYNDGKRDVYIRFSDSIAKIVLCTFKEKKTLESGREIKKAASYLAAGDYVRFGRLITEEYSEITENGGAGRRTKALFNAAVRLKDGLGYGVLESGGIFAIVENKKVNAFMQNIKKEYETYYGTPPDFYVTRPESSGVNAIKKDV